LPWHAIFKTQNRRHRPILICFRRRGIPKLDPSAAEFRRRRQPGVCRAASAGKKIGAPPGQPKFVAAAAAAAAAALFFSARRGASDKSRSC